MNYDGVLANATDMVDASYRYGYAFDDIGNRKTSAERETNFTYAANNLNQYTTVGHGLRVAPQEEFVPQYDLDGNQTLVKTATGVWSVSYNGENRPVLWTQGTNTILMSFDRMGRRVTKNDQRFVYNGYLQIAEFSTAIPNSSFLLHNSYIWDPTGPVATRPLAWTTRTTNHQSPTTSFYTHDGNKNVSEVIASDRSLAAHYEYAPFGALTVPRGEAAAANLFRFSSEYAEDDTATVYYNYRHYEPVAGRWMQRDIGEEDLSMNLYGFIDNGQVNVIDDIGLVKFSHPESCPNCSRKMIEGLINKLKSVRDGSKEKKDILQKVKDAWGYKSGWDNTSSVRVKIADLIAKLNGSGITIECCYNGNACKESGGIKPDAFSPRPVDSGAKNPLRLDSNTITSIPFVI